jgi:uncharacterized membrane protein YfcA
VEYVIVCIAALLASGLTLFSGFGLGTLLMPVVAIFFPLEIAIAITAVVHFANNLFKLVLMGHQADKSILLKFGLPAVFAAFIGAGLLNWLGAVPPIFQYTAFGRNLAVSPLKLVVGVLIIFFVSLELSERFSKVELDKKWLPLGAGNQRSAMAHVPFGHWKLRDKAAQRRPPSRYIISMHNSLKGI